jgi:hypothetical protein
MHRTCAHDIERQVSGWRDPQSHRDQYCMDEQPMSSQPSLTRRFTDSVMRSAAKSNTRNTVTLHDRLSLPNMRMTASTPTGLGQVQGHSQGNASGGTPVHRACGHSMRRRRRGARSTEPCPAARAAPPASATLRMGWPAALSSGDTPAGGAATCRASRSMGNGCTRHSA